MFCDIKSKTNDSTVRQIIAAAVFDDSEEGLDKWAEKIRSSEPLQLYAWIENGAILGVCSYEVQIDFVEILTIAVAENARKRGVGGAMVAALQNKYGMALEAETDDGAVGFYRRCGFNTSKICKSYDNNVNVRRWTCVLPIP